MNAMLRERWAGLAARERLVVAGGTVVAAVSLIFVFIVDPMLERRELLDRQILRKQRAVLELTALGSDYAAARSRLARINQRIEEGGGEFSLLPFLEDAAAAAEVRDRIVSMQPQPTQPAQGYQETAVELRLDAVSLPRLLSLLVALETSPHLVQVKRLQLKPRFDASHLLDATLLVSTYAKA